LVDPSGYFPEEGAGSVKELPLYCFNRAQNKLTRNHNRSQFCAPNVDGTENRADILSRIARLQPRLPSTTWWAELDKAWGFSVYVTLDLSQYSPSEEMYEGAVDPQGRPVSLPRNWVDRGGAADIQTQGTGKLPDDFDQFGGRTVKWNGGNVTIGNDNLTHGGRVGRVLDDLVYKAVAAPYTGNCSFPNQSLLFAAALKPVNPTSLLSVEDSGGAINCANGRIDVYVGLNTVLGAIADSSIWGGAETPHSLWALVELPQPLLNECSLPETIDNVHIKEGAGATLN
jgi:hypothetical protein